MKNQHEKNILIELPEDIKFKIEKEAQNKTSELMDNIFTIDKRVDQIMFLRNAYNKLLITTASEEYFKNEEIKNLLEVIQRKAK